jgi:phospholipid-translocating ATPase
MKYEKGLTLLGIVGFKEELKKDAKEFIELARNCNMKIWILSGDEEASTISCASAIKLAKNGRIKRLKITKKKKEGLLQ